MLSKLKIKYIQSLGQKKFRDEHGVFVAEGPKTVAELIREKNVNVLELFATASWLKENASQVTGINAVEVSEQDLERITLMQTPRDVLAIIKKFDETKPGDSPVSLALDTIQDPGNFGTIIRIADWFGVNQVVCSAGCADLYNPKVVQSTMGSIARVSVHYTDLAKWISEKKDACVYATLLEGQDITKMDRVHSGIILIGNESRGIDPELLKLANVSITIPKFGKAESLNAAVATGVILSHLVDKGTG